MRYLPNLESSLERGGGTDKVEKSDEQASDFERAAEQSMDDGNSVKDLEQVRIGGHKSIEFDKKGCNPSSASSL